MADETPKRPSAIWPLCPHCKSDPLNLKRLRYDFPDGVIVESLFCAACRACIALQIVGVSRSKN